VSLAGKTILVTSPKNSCAELLGLLESEGATAVHVPTIEIVGPDSWETCDATIWRLAEYDSVCFTSKNAVEKLIQRIRLIRPQALNTLATRTLYAVGEKTKALLESTGFSVQPIPRNHSAEELAHSFYGQNIAGKRFLFPKSNIASDVLPTELRLLGAFVDELVTYKTVMPDTENLERVRISLNKGKIDIITFFSPSSVRNFVELFGTDVLQHMFVAVIGPTTEEASKELGIEAALVAKQQTAEGLVRDIVEYYK
jgi:uroporphyrinogen III methyltransferase/synthase